METVVTAMMAIVLFNFLLKTSFYGVKGVAVVALLAMLATAISCPLAIEQSKTQIADWLGKPALMQDTAVVLCIDVALQLLFCSSMAGKLAGEVWNTKKRALHMALVCFPGLAAFVVMFSLLVWTIFALPGIDFQLIAWGVGGFLFAGVFACAYGLKALLPEKDIRLELLFMGNVCVGIIGIVATVNGKTAVVGSNQVEWLALFGFLALVLVGTAVGYAILKIKTNKKTE